MSGDIKKLLESIDSISESRYRIRTKGANAYEVVINGGEHDGKVMLLTKDLAKAERALDNFEQGYKKSKAGREEEWAKRDKEDSNQIKFESELGEQNDFPRQAMDYGSGMKPRTESDHAAKDKSNFENDPRWSEYNKLQARQEFSQARELMNRMRYEHHMDESVNEGIFDIFKKKDKTEMLPLDDADIDLIKSIDSSATNRFKDHGLDMDKPTFNLNATHRNDSHTGGVDVVYFKHPTEYVIGIQPYYKSNERTPGNPAGLKYGSFITKGFRNANELKQIFQNLASKMNLEESVRENHTMKKQQTNESMWDEDVGTDPVVICMHKDGHKMYFKEFHANGNYYWTADKGEARDFESEDAASDAIKMIKAHDPAVYKMGLVGKTHGEKPYPIYAEPMHEIGEDVDFSAEASPLTHGIDNLNVGHEVDEESNVVWKGRDHNGEVTICKENGFFCIYDGDELVSNNNRTLNGALKVLSYERPDLEQVSVMDEDWSADEYNRQKMIDAPKSRQHNPVSAPGKHSYIPRSHELEEENDNGQDEIIQDLSGKLQGPWPLDGDRHENEMEDSPMQADPDSVIDEFYTSMPSKQAGKNPKQVGESVLAEKSAPGQESWIKANKSKFVKEYGKKKGLEVLYATAWKRSKKNESVNNDEQSQAFESMFAEAMEDKPMTKKTKKINESFDLTQTEDTKKIVDSLGSMMKLAGLQSQKAEYKPYVAESEGDVFSRMMDYFDIEAPKSEEGSGEDSGENCGDDGDTEVVAMSSDGEGHFSGLADNIKALATGKEPGKHFGGLADKLNALKDGEVEEERETPDFKGIGDKLRNHFKKDESVTEGDNWWSDTPSGLGGPTGNYAYDEQPHKRWGDEEEPYFSRIIKNNLKKKQPTKEIPPNKKDESVNEDLSATLTMSKCEDGKSMSLTITDQHGDELDKLLCLSGIAQPQAVAVVSAHMEPTNGEAPAQAEGGYQGAYEMVGEADEKYEDPDSEPTGEYGDTHEYSNRPKKDVYDLDTQLNKGSDLNAPKGQYAKEYDGDNRMDTAKRDAAFESKLWAEYKGIK
jgi:hypothetical protein